MIDLSSSLVVIIVLGLSPMQRLEVESKGLIVKRPKFVSDSMWRQCQHLEATFEPFEVLCRSILNNPTQWHFFLKAEDPYSIMSSPFEGSQTHGRGYFSVVLVIGLLS